MIQIISWNCVDILDVCVECVLPSSHRLTSKTCLCLSDADFLQQKCLLALEVEHPIGHYFLDCSAWPRSGLRTKDMAAWCNTLWSWCRLKKHCNICATSTLKRTRRSIGQQDPNLCHFHVPCDKMHSNLILACSCFVATWDMFCLGDTSDNCFVSGLPCLIFSWNWRLFLFLLFAQSLKVLGSDKRMGEKIPSSCLVSILTLMNNPRRNIVVGLAFLVLHVPVHTTCPTSSTLFADLEPQHTFTTY